MHANEAKFLCPIFSQNLVAIRWVKAWRIFTVLIGEKKQNDRETWYMIDSSFITTLPDTWGIGEKFLMLPINKWNREYQRVTLGGITCDSHDYYDSEEHINEVFLPKD